MKSLLKSLLLTSIGLYGVVLVIPGFKINGGIETYFIASIALAVLNLVVKPLVNLVLLPINIITLGMFRWLVNVFTLGMVPIFVNQFSINAFEFQGINIRGFTIPTMNLSVFWVATLGALLLSVFVGLVDWVIED